ncbi:uncharacterized protein KQ657_000701 [Scheffersomyces spartinae]|uniref:Uncharacterized protein n=1 Tax=Scheffersomyces spartinae TaxID=45513 RepID=A0A9P7VA40_9ASCO|nr:uncharacterized protein KQ657_000701 [Scheffersomyces spartinae]KAG7193628.1 hypothetical protein KQ657_000701 [Scheffersomyces spartinae]
MLFQNLLVCALVIAGASASFVPNEQRAKRHNGEIHSTTMKMSGSSVAAGSTVSTGTTYSYGTTFSVGGTVSTGTTVSTKASASAVAYQSGTTEYYKDIEDHSYEFIKFFFDKFLYPEDAKEADKINSTLFVPDVRGRVSLTRNFISQELNTEYIFGLFARVEEVPFSMIGHPTEYQLDKFISLKDVISASAIVNFTFPQLSDWVLPIPIEAWIKLVPSSESDIGYSIKEYDVNFRNFDWAQYQAMHRPATSILGPQIGGMSIVSASTEQLIKAKAIDSICKIAMDQCTGSNKQYGSYAECFAHLMTVRMGESFEGGQNTIFCRNLHQAMVKYRPDIHCEHLGKSGGDMCTDKDITYNSVVWGAIGYYSNWVYP